MEFVDESEAVISAYKVDEFDSTSCDFSVSSSRGVQHNPGERLPSDQSAHAPALPDYKDYSSIGQDDFATYETTTESSILLGPSLRASLDEPDKLQRSVSAQRERKPQERLPELKFQTFQKSSTGFDTFRPMPRSHFSSDAMSVWPLRSIEESRLLQHFIQNLAPWVRVGSEIAPLSTMLTSRLV